MKTKQIRTLLVLLAAWILLPRVSQAYYNASTGRWLNRDPIEEQGFQTRTGQESGEEGPQGRYAGESKGLQNGAEPRQQSDALVADPVTIAYPHDVNTLYAFVDNSPTMVFDVFGLFCLPAIDGANHSCCACEMLVVELRINPGLVGHAFLRTSHMTSGHYPNPQWSAPLSDWISDAVHPGQNLDDATHPYTRARIYSACPLTMTLLEIDMILHFSDKFGLSNAKARNCAGWALERLQDVGYPPPFPPNKRHLKPADL
jgi:hypothetical protein